MTRSKTAIVLLGVLGAAILFAVVACGSGVVTLHEADNGGQVVLYKGQVLVVDLESNASTGYRWELAEVDDAVLEQTGHEYQAGWFAVLSPGAGGKDVWRFLARSSGSTTLTLEYKPGYKESAEPAGIFSVQVVVR